MEVLYANDGRVCSLSIASGVCTEIVGELGTHRESSESIHRLASMYEGLRLCGGIPYASEGGESLILRIMEVHIKCGWNMSRCTPPQYVGE